MLIGARTAAWLPYDAEIEYLEGAYYAYIDTGFCPCATTNIECVAWLSKTTAAYVRLWGTSDGSNSRYVFRFGNTPAQGASYEFQLSYGAGLGYEGNTDSKLTQNAAVAAGYVTYAVIDRKCWFNGTDYKTFSAAQNTTRFPYSLAILGWNATGDFTGGVGAVCGNGIRVKSVKISENGVTLFDFIPVRKGSVGYLYDKVGGKLYGSGGTGAFVVGPDKT